MNKRIILVGPSAAGKTFMSEKFQQAGYKLEVSYTSRIPRKGEIDEVDYIFLSKHEFEKKIKNNEFYEYTEYNGNYYGTGLKEFYNADIFVWETEGVKKLNPEDRKNSLVIFINTNKNERINRMINRKWSLEYINKRLEIDDKKFNQFTDFDIEIQSDTLK